MFQPSYELDFFKQISVISCFFQRDFCSQTLFNIENKNAEIVIM